MDHFYKNACKCNYFSYMNIHSPAVLDFEVWKMRAMVLIINIHKALYCSINLEAWRREVGTTVQPSD